MLCFIISCILRGWVHQFNSADDEAVLLYCICFLRLSSVLLFVSVLRGLCFIFGQMFIDRECQMALTKTQDVKREYYSNA